MTYREAEMKEKVADGTVVELPPEHARVVSPIVIVLKANGEPRM